MNIAFARSTVAAFAVQIEQFTEPNTTKSAKRVRAVSNCVQHAYPDSVGTVSISVYIEGDLLTIVIEDQGVGIENVELAKTTEFTTKPDENLGWGFNFMEACMDEISVESYPGKGTKLTMKKRPHANDAQ